MRRSGILLLLLTWTPGLVACSSETQRTSTSTLPTSHDTTAATDLTLAVPNPLSGSAAPQPTIGDAFDPIDCNHVEATFDAPLPAGVVSMLQGPSVTCLLNRTPDAVTSVTMLLGSDPGQLASVSKLTLQQVAAAGTPTLSITAQPVSQQSTYPTGSNPAAGYAAFSISGRNGVLARQSEQLVTAAWDGPAGSTQRVVLLLGSSSQERDVLAMVSALDAAPVLQS